MFTLVSFKPKPAFKTFKSKTTSNSEGISKTADSILDSFQLSYYVKLIRSYGYIVYPTDQCACCQHNPAILV